MAGARRKISRARNLRVDMHRLRLDFGFFDFQWPHPTLSVSCTPHSVLSVSVHGRKPIMILQGILWTENGSTVS